MRAPAPVWVGVGAALALAAPAARPLPFVTASTSSGARAIYEPLRPARIFDTRKTADAPAFTGPVTRTVQVTGKGGVPTDATAAAVTITVIRSTTSGYLTGYPAGQTRPTVYSGSYVAAQTSSTSLSLLLGAGGAVALYLSAGTAHVVVEVSGYFHGHDHDDRYLTKDQAQARTAPDALACGAGQFLRSVAADGTPTCAAPPSAPPVEPATQFLGTGTGDLSVQAGVTAGISGDFYRANLTLGDGATFFTNGYRVVLTGTLTMGEGATIQRNGNPGTLAAAGAALAPGSLGGSGAGACFVPAPQVTNSLGGAGSNMGGTGTVAVRPPMTVGGSGVLSWVPNGLLGRTFDGAPINGGGGGGGSACGAGATNGGGGGGGGVVVVVARHVVLTGSQAFVTADGGASQAAGPGGGGVVVVGSFDPKPAGLVLRAAAGASATWTGSAGTTRYYDF